MVALADWTLVVTLVLHSIFDLSYGLLPKVGRENLIEQAAKYSSGTREEEEAIVVEFEKKLLNLFGLKRRPNPGKDMQIPKLMQHLYKAHMGDTFEDQDNLIGVWEEGFDLPSHDITSRVNTARSFHHIDKDELLPGMPDHHIRLRFDLTTLPEEEVIGAAELLLHRQGIADHMSPGDNRLHRINIYEIVKIPKDEDDKYALPEVGKLNRGRFGSEEKRPIIRLMDTRLVDARNSTWEKFDIGPVVTKWARNHHDENYGLVVEVVTDRNDPPEGKSHVRLKRDLHREVTDREWLDKRPTLLTYTHDGKETTLQRRSRAKRNSRKRDAGSMKKKRKRKRRNRPCARHNLYVDFAAVGWDDWIVAPHGYDAFYCQGQCLFPLAEHLNATNHAIVQTLANSVHPFLAPKPCCVPTELDSISMLYVDEYDLVVLKNYQHMTVLACGCR